MKRMINSQIRSTLKTKEAKKNIVKKQTGSKSSPLALNKTITIFAKNIDHDLHTPLAVIGINLDNADYLLNNSKNGGLAKADQKALLAHLKNIRAAAINASTLINMLTFKLNLLAQDIAELQKEPQEKLTVVSLINEMLKELPVYEHQRKLIKWDQKNATDSVITALPLYLKHLLFNMLKCSLKLMQEAESGEIKITTHQSNKFIDIVINNSTVGLKSMQFKQLLEPLDMVAAQNFSHNLHFGYKIMELCHGELIYEDCGPHGANFILRFPRLK